MYRLMAGKKASRVSRAPAPKPEGTDPGPKQASLAADTKTKPGQVAFGKTGATANPAKSGSVVTPRPGRGVRDRSGAATGSSIFDKADAGNRRLGRRDRS